MAKFHWACIAALLLSACADDVQWSSDGGAGDTSACIDRDDDGFGDNCSRGSDCDDADPKRHRGCATCTRPAEGCACDSSHKPLSCYLEPSAIDDGGVVMCHEGTRYCRDREWSGCESIVSYPKPTTSSTSQAIVGLDASPETCNDCAPNCFTVRDNLDPTDASLGSGTNTTIGDGGGLTLGTYEPDASEPDSGAYDPATCMIGTAPDLDCDGVLDAYDPYPTQKPFATSNSTLFFDLPPGETGVGAIDLVFNLNSADVYFLVDQTASMTGERDRLKADLTSGTFIAPSFTCSDYDYDKLPNNELKSLGIVGAIRCLIRDVNFGVGHFRELPFAGYGSTLDLDAKELVAFRNYSDITSNISQVIAAVGKLDVQGNLSWPENPTVVLNTLVTGNGMYFGVDRPGVATRTTCPAGTWGYPCFRSNAIPIVLLFTDAPMHNGPPSNYSPYPTSFAIAAGTSQSYTMVPSTNETFASALDLGDLTTKYLSYTGNTTGMASNMTATAISCDSAFTPNSPDAFFKFSLSSTQTVKITTEGSDFDTAIGVWSAAPSTMNVLPGLPNTNDNGTNAYSFGNTLNKWQQASGNTSALASDYSANDLSCGAYAATPDATFTFTLPSATRVSLDTSGSAFGTVVNLFSGTPPALSTYTAVPNTNDTLATAHAVGTLNGQLKGFSGSTSTGIVANYPGAFFGCGAASSSPDAVYSFSLTSPTRVRLSAEGSALDTVLALADNGTRIPSWSSALGNESESSARNLGVIDGEALSITGNTTSMQANYNGAVAGCSATSTAPDAVYRFTLNSPRTVQLDTDGSAFDSVLSLYKGEVSGSSTILSNKAHETGALAYDIGTINELQHVVSGGSTSGMAANYNSTQIGCSVNSTTSPDAVFKFHLDAPTRVRVDTEGSTFNTLLSLHSASPPAMSITTLASNVNEAAASAQSLGNVTNNYVRFDGSTASMGAQIFSVHDGGSCFANDAAPDAVYSFTVSTAGNYELSTAGSGFDTVLGLYPSTITTPVAPATSNRNDDGDTKGSAVDVGVLDGQWRKYSGYTTEGGWFGWGATVNDRSLTSCGASSSGRDLFYKFTLSSTRTVVIDTGGTSFNSVIALYRSDDTYITCNNGGSVNGDLITQTLTAGVYYLMIDSESSSSVGNFQISFKDATAGTNITQCDDESGGSGTSKLTRLLSPGTYHAVVKGKAAASKGSYRLAVRHVEWSTPTYRLFCSDDVSGVNNKSRIEEDLAAGDYWVVVKGSNAVDAGAYTLTVQDITSPSTVGLVSCNDNHDAVTTSKITAALDAGTYFAMVKGRFSGSSGDYSLNVRDSSVSLASVLQCDHDGGANNTSKIERDLPAGDYKVLLKGKSAGAKGAYKLAMRDLTATPFTRLGCNYNGSNDGKSFLDSNLAAGTYTVVLKGDSPTASGAYKLAVRDVTNLTTADAALQCDDDSGIGVTSSLSRSLGAGTYYAAVKGKTATYSGEYQLNIGVASKIAASTYVPPLWSQTKAELLAKKVRVMTVLSCHDDGRGGTDCNTARTQAKDLATSTNALGASLAPLVFDIDSDGSGLSTTVVDGVASLAQYLEMNVKAAIAWEPHANPGFAVVVKAIDEPGDGCDPPIGIEHQKCAPGATPRFQIEFTNPLAAPVPLNSFAIDPKGGYWFRADLIANNQYVVDSVPIYIIPAEVTQPGPPAPVVHNTGTYNQNLAAPGCSGGTSRPDWNDLSWVVSAPNGTSVTFSACGGAKPADLDACTPKQVVTITGGAACATDSECAAGSSCSSTGNCQRLTGGTCTSSTDCRSGATCMSNQCVFSGQPLYVGSALGNQNFLPNLRVQIGMTGNTQDNVSPTVHSWEINYVCKSSL